MLVDGTGLSVCPDTMVTVRSLLFFILPSSQGAFSISSMGSVHDVSPDLHGLGMERTTCGQSTAEICLNAQESVCYFHGEPSVLNPLASVSRLMLEGVLLASETNV